MNERLLGVIMRLHIELIADPTVYAISEQGC